MRAGLSTIQQTLTLEAASVLNHSIAEAGRRNHGQTTPLHVAATLLASPSGFLRQACIRSHPNSSHPLQCRALELCFSVALERLPTAQNLSPGHEPPISNALMAALKRAQAHQRRGCPEQQQQPLLAVKVELEQLIISILDDPSVSRVMREASFSSPAVKATIEQQLNSAPPAVNPSSIGLNLRQNLNPMPSRNLYLNPRLQPGNSMQSGQQRGEEVKRVIEILLRSKKRNPVLVGESEPEAVIKELLRRIETKEMAEGALKNVQVIPLVKEFASDRSQIPAKLKELGTSIESRIGGSNGGGIILDLGDLKWLVEQPVSLGVPGSATALQQQAVSEAGHAAVAEMGKLLMKFGGRLWLIGTATCETYLRCQVYHPSMENDWDLQAMPIAARVPLPGMFPRLGGNGIISSSVESLLPQKTFSNVTVALPRRVPESVDPARRMNCCTQCLGNYEQELAKLVAMEFEKSSTEAKPEAAQPALPPWLQSAKVHKSDFEQTDHSLTKDQELILKEKTQELQKKWIDKCLQLHPNHHHGLGLERLAPTMIPVTGLYNSNLLPRQPLQPRVQLNGNLGDSLQLNPNLLASSQTLQLNSNQLASQPKVQLHLGHLSGQPSERAGSPPASPVRTDLVLGPTKATATSLKKDNEERASDLLGCISFEPQSKLNDSHTEKLASTLDADSFKRLLKGLAERVWWQHDAASAVAATVTNCKFGGGKRRVAGSKGDVWILFTGPDRVGKKKMASSLAELVYGSTPITICLGSRRGDEDFDVSFRGKTALDRIAEAVRRNPFSVIVLEDIDEADMLVRGNIKRAMERGRLADSHGREFTLGNVIFILTTKALSSNCKSLSKSLSLDEEKLASLASGGWQLKLTLSEKTGKRRANWLCDEGRPTKPRKDAGSGLAFDLNEVADAEDRADGSRNSSDLTVDHEDDPGLETRLPSIASVPDELLNAADDTIVFKPVDFAPIRTNLANTISSRFSTVVGDKLTVEVDDEALDRILGGVWLGRTRLEDWSEKVLVPCLNQLKARIPLSTLTSSDDILVARLELAGDSDNRCYGDWLPSTIKVEPELAQ
ncbi:hypothetical protein RJ641_025369 [Dillenia turbinata]|uniref:Clp R domain-containing protein n=1 Tax=Dillenia turbinata TaxID=194707 RepID=A0AAN8ZNV3_9MAGN